MESSRDVFLGRLVSLIDRGPTSACDGRVEPSKDGRRGLAPGGRFVDYKNVAHLASDSGHSSCGFAEVGRIPSSSDVVAPRNV